MPEISGLQRQRLPTTLSAQEALQHAAGSEQLGADINGLYAAGGRVQVTDLPGTAYSGGSCSSKLITLDTALHRRGAPQDIAYALARSVGFMRTDCGAGLSTDSLDSYVKGRTEGYAQMLAYGFRIQKEMAGKQPDQTLERGDGIRHMQQLYEQNVQRLGEKELIKLMTQELPTLMPRAVQQFREDFRALTASALSDREKDAIAAAAGEAARRAVQTAVRSAL